MARSVHIWVVENSSEGLATAVFTVKRELREWLQKQTPEYLSELAIQKFKDGGSRIGYIGTGTDFLAEEQMSSKKD